MATQGQTAEQAGRQSVPGWDDKYLLGSYKMHPKATSGKLSGNVEAPHCDHYDAAVCSSSCGRCGRNVCKQCVCDGARQKNRERERERRDSEEKGWKKCVACL